MDDKSLSLKILLLALVSLFASAPAFSSEKTSERASRLVSALIVVESKGNDQALGDIHLKFKAFGCLQIRQPCVDDVNRAFGTKYLARDCLGNRALSIEICEKYLSLYATKKYLGREVTDEDRARIWNGGPNGYKIRRTDSYWKKVKDVL